MGLKIINPMIKSFVRKAPYIAPKIEPGVFESLRLNSVARSADTVEFIPQIVKDIRALKSDKLIQTIDSKYLHKTEEELLYFIKNGNITQEVRYELAALLSDIKASGLITMSKEGIDIFKADKKLIDNAFEKSFLAMSKFIKVFDDLLFPKSVNSKVIEIEKKLAALGVDARLTDHENCAECVLNAYRNMYDKGIRDFPKVRYQLGNRSHNVAIPNKSLQDRYTLLDDDMFRITTREPIGSYANQCAEGIICHEAGHTFNYAGSSRLLGFDGGSFKKVAEELSIGKEVSIYATMSEDECMAEIFAGIMGGKKYPQNIIDFYKSRNGYIPPGIKL